MIISAKGVNLDGYYLLNGKTVHDLNSAVIREILCSYDVSIFFQYKGGNNLFNSFVHSHPDGYYTGTVIEFYDWDKKIVNPDFKAYWCTEVINPSLKDAYKTFKWAIIKAEDAIMDSFIG